MSRFDVAVLLLRVSFGLSMTYHGINKVRRNGLSGTSSWFASIGMKMPRLQAKAAASTEIIAGLLLAVGLLTPLASTMFVSLMVVAIWTVHWKVGYFIFLPNGGWEYCASIIVVASAIGIVGPGQMSLDDVFGLSSSWGIVAFPFGVLAAMCHLALSYRPNNDVSSS